MSINGILEGTLRVLARDVGCLCLLTFTKLVMTDKNLLLLVSQNIVKFEMDQSYAPTNSSEFFTDEVLEKWNDLMPVGMGFVWVNDTHKYHDLPTPIDWPDKTVFTTSVTHQLHCLVSAFHPFLHRRSFLSVAMTSRNSVAHRCGVY